MKDFKEKSENVVLIFFVLIFVMVLIRTAWLSDDAYITFRTVDNFVNGHGLTWNTVERVQTYTNPLWMFLVSGLYFFTREVFFTSIFLSIGLSLMAVFLLVFSIANSRGVALLGVAILILSKAFVDYSTSGLENPLTHLILALFLVVFFRFQTSLKVLGLLSFIAAMGVLNRMDTALIFLPPLLYSLWRLRSLKAVFAVLTGFVPFILWECFSLFYYGFLFPNSAYAKLNTGIEGAALAKQGFCYMLNSVNMDPLTLLVIAGAIVVAFLVRERGNLAVSAGIVLYLLYTVKVGGDFMSGRFLTAPLFCAVALIARSCFRNSYSPALLTSLAMAALIGISSPFPPIFSNADYGRRRRATTDNNGVSDERAGYYPYSGLLRATRDQEFPNHRWAAEGRKLRAEGPAVLVYGGAGFRGFYAGPEVHIIDFFALTDPLLSRLPIPKNHPWRIGHFRRRMPEGYLETLRFKENKIKDKNLAAYYDKLSLVIRGNLISRKRLAEIWRINTGKYDQLIDFASYREPSFQFSEFDGIVFVKLSQINAPKSEGTPWDQADNIIFGKKGVHIDLEKRSRAPYIEVSLDHNDNYEIVYYRGRLRLSRQTAVRRNTRPKGLAVHLLQVPRRAIRKSYDGIRIIPIRGDDNYSLGHLRLLK